jgi:AraC-like DNA-binding protein
MDLLWDGASIAIAGPDTRAQVFSVDRPGSMTGLRFAPGFAPRVLGIPAGELTDQHVALDAVWSPRTVRRITDLLAASRTPGRVLETVALQHCPPADDDAALIEAIVELAKSGCNSAEIAQQVGYSPRQLQRRSGDAFGYGAKTLSRILRMQRALDFLRRGDRAAQSAARAG